MPTVFIAGVDQGIGQALAHTYLDHGYTVFATAEHEDKNLLSRPDYYCIEIDPYTPETVYSDVKEFTRRHAFDRVILSSETLGNVCDITDLPLHELQTMLNVNFLSPKQILDAILHYAKADQAVLIGADTTRLMHRGWGAYIASKEAMSAMIPFYAEQFPNTHFSTISPNIVATPELAHIFKTANTRRFPSVSRIQGGLVQPPEQAAEALLIGIERARDFRSGERHLLNDLLKQ